ncbi:ATP-binding protein [Pelagicoccus mobilis]|uniref:Histidine kinase domain-containing protein n=1 Tax=Pelagicoccus mobilis TaxID=415221 RepID=A0A934VQ72_9BACT|nr:ATP-binding protein [Pelagicoccus mobilis]MBK1876199.1 hypothetical protein [Pelagicoccus mobilis]
MRLLTHQLKPLFASLTLAGSLSLGYASDPHTPAAADEASSELNNNWSPLPHLKIRQLEAELGQLRNELEELPYLYPILSQNRIGYHSSFDGDTEAAQHTIDFNLSKNFRVRSVALVPAYHPSEQERNAYAFPKRFKIEFRDPDTNEFETLVNWMERDFPSPGRYPLFFSDIERVTNKIRLTVAKGEEDPSNYFALGEFYIWGGTTNNFLVDNVALWTSTRVSASSNFSLPPKWDLEFLKDGVSGLGFPLSKIDEHREDLMIRSEEGAQISETVELTIDLGKSQRIGRFDLWPAKAPDGLALPGVGFPQSVKVEVSNDPSFEDFTAIKPTGEADKGQYGALFSVCIKPPNVRYLRVTLEGLQIQNDARILGLGEIAMYDVEGNLVSGEIVKHDGIPMHFTNQVARLLDGYCFGKRILPDLKWIEALAQRKPLESRIAALEAELASTQVIWGYLRDRLLVAAAILFCVLVSVVVFYQQIRKKRELSKQAERITRDLHDEVGSSLGSISLLAEELTETSDDKQLANDLDDLSLMAREATASLREIIKVKSQQDVSLAELFDSLSERASKVLRGVSLSYQISEELPEQEIPLSIKRHISMLFKEAIHNCARHSQATELSIIVSSDSQFLYLQIKDNGIGFEPSQIQRGWGLDNMKQRADEMRGEIMIESTPGAGTSIHLKTPLASLSQEPTHGYKTSNV